MVDKYNFLYEKQYWTQIYIRFFNSINSYNDYMNSDYNNIFVHRTI